jgi:MerR family transcriptional regulator, light-induced transcriptional regulator
MHSFSEAFREALENEDKARCVKLAFDELSSGRIGLVDLYMTILAPALNSIGCDTGKKDLCIWKEHIRTSIVRSVIENSYIFVQREKEENGIKDNGYKVFVVCPDGEYHEIGARMAADFFELNGFDTVFVGSSTPSSEFLNILDSIKPDFIAISVTNYYNIVSAKRTIELIRQKSDHDIRIIAGGSAFNARKDLYKETGADHLLQTFDDIKKFAGEVGNVISV